jgi:hypothetical protein
MCLAVISGNQIQQTLKILANSSEKLLPQTGKYKKGEIASVFSGSMKSTAGN